MFTVTGADVALDPRASYTRADNRKTPDADGDHA
jgi:hypothetical protein